MARALSIDLRDRVVSAIEQGSSCRQAALRFGVSASSAIRWYMQFCEAGDVRPKRHGGDRRSGHIEAESEFILKEIAANPDITLAVLQAKLKSVRGQSFAISTIWRFLARRNSQNSAKKEPGKDCSRKTGGDRSRTARRDP